MRNLPNHSTVESIGHPDRATTVVQALDFAEYDETIEMPLVKLIADLQAVIEQIPVEFRENAIMRIHASGDYASASACVQYLRPETDEELSDRRRWLAGIDEDREKRDRQEFVRLQRKYQHP